MTHDPVSAPTFGLQALEQRAIFEIGAFAAASPYLRLLGRGDRHPVLVLPGFTGGDESTQPLRWFLRGRGYWTHGWRLGTNLGPTPEVLSGIDDRLAALYERHGRKVSVVGWSLGGIYARQLGRRHPEAVRQVITLGTPFRMRAGDRSAATGLYERLAARHAAPADDDDIGEDERPPLPVPSTAIYTRTDGVVKWHTCIDREGPHRENIEVVGSHSGLGFNPAAMLAIADRLAQPEDDWRPFQAPSWVRRLFPPPAVWADRDLAAAGG